MLAVDLKRTPLFPAHVETGARMVEFAGWLMPLQYAGIIEEHRAVRSAAGLFDVSHMGRLEVAGDGAFALLQRLLTNDIARLAVGGGQYSLLLREDGGILDDLIVYRTEERRYLLVVNAINTSRDGDWLAQHALEQEVEIVDRTGETAMLALQGPRSLEYLQSLARFAVEPLPRFACIEGEVARVSALCCRTGYTGEDGFELVAAAFRGLDIWRGLLGLGVKPCGLGARDTLRLEAGYPLYGQEIDTTVNPLEAGLGWAVAFHKGDFVGRSALERIRKERLRRKLIGFRMVEPGIPRTGFPIAKNGRIVGRVTSGNYAPSLGYPIGMGYVPLSLAEVGTELEVIIRGRPARAVVVKRPFYKK